MVPLVLPLPWADVLSARTEQTEMSSCNRPLLSAYGMSGLEDSQPVCERTASSPCPEGRCSPYTCLLGFRVLVALPAPLEGASRGMGLPCPPLASIAPPCPCVSGVPCLLLCIWGLEVAQLHWGVLICLGCMFPRRARGSLCLQSQIGCQQAEGLASRG